uniref:Uncharacterized protein n=1 Tax=Steinernema glaseri TaxID=37863 RepID=A0A1I8APD1_9BILA
MLLHFNSIAVIALGFLIVFPSSTIGQRAEETPCVTADQDTGVVAGLFNNTFFYFAYNGEPVLTLDPKKLFGDKPLAPAPSGRILRHFMPTTQNRVIIFFTEGDKFFYVYYELENLKDHAKEGSARVLPSLDLQEKHEVKYVDGGSPSLVDYNVQWTMDKLYMFEETSNGLVEKPLAISVGFNKNEWDILWPNPSFFSITRRLNRIIESYRRTFDGRIRFTEDRLSASSTSEECYYAETASTEFKHVLVLPERHFKMDHNSSGYGVNASMTTTTTTTTTTSTTTTTTTTTTAASSTQEPLKSARSRRHSSDEVLAKNEKVLSANAWGIAAVGAGIFGAVVGAVTIGLCCKPRSSRTKETNVEIEKWKISSSTTRGQKATLGSTSPATSKEPV